ncbi:oxidoreductase [Streptomyces hainanensis]|uniref:SDR family NAD(P)-dependent oxidoreductase n=1 Tax=Streptomyces hainanensis TaxID=402648 RepID=A0A4R4TB67_9ACTN|nr:oxidoreductase [Streptomyces hainanensis]TDC73276.1 SDR family NAD(P)-dependent oxidoreductase [Streptomyces hainanensis]
MSSPDSAQSSTAVGRVWLITGTSSGFGRAIAEAALAAGDTVVATARRPETLDDLVAAYPDRVRAVRLDVTDNARIAAVVAEVLLWYGRVDVLVNNAGHGQVGAVEETTDRELRDLMDLHLHGPAALTRAVLPGMRKQGSGAVVQISSFGGQVAYPGFSAYCATKFALEGLSEALAAEVAPHGIKVLIVEPGAFRTEFSGAGLHQSAELPAYAETVGQTRQFITSIDGTQPGDPARAAEAIVAALDGDKTPLRLPLGNDAYDGLLAHLDAVREELTAWESVARDVGFPDASA